VTSSPGRGGLRPQRELLGGREGEIANQEETTGRHELSCAIGTLFCDRYSSHTSATMKIVKSAQCEETK